MTKTIHIFSIIFLLVIGVVSSAHGQEAAISDDQIDFSADKIVYDQNTNVVTASGNVISP